MSAIDTAVAAVLAEHSQADTEEVRAGVARVAERWTDADGDEQADASMTATREHSSHLVSLKARPWQYHQKILWP